MTENLSQLNAPVLMTEPLTLIQANNRLVRRRVSYRLTGDVTSEIAEGDWERRWPGA